jgi:hypothetical protein
MMDLDSAFVFGHKSYEDKSRHKTEMLEESVGGGKARLTRHGPKVVCG